MRKSIKDLSLQITEPEYRALPHISYSTLSRFEREGWRKLSSLFDRIDTPSLTFGSAVDTYLTDGKDAFDAQFIVCEFPNISDNLITITKSLFGLKGETNKTLSDFTDDEISDMAVANDYYVADRFYNLRVKNVKESCAEYYSLLQLAQDKTILSQSDYNDVQNCVNELKNNPRTKNFFFIDPWDKDTEKEFQLKFEASYLGIKVRCMFDEIIVDHKNMIIYPIDLKTTGHPEEEFMDSFLQWRYDIQAKLYTYILQETINKDEYFKDFKIMPYHFVVINRRTVSPLVFVFKDNFSEETLISKRGYEYRDWRVILEELNYYLKNPTTRYSIKNANQSTTVIDNYILE